MINSVTTIAIALAVSFSSAPAYAVDVYKWVDAGGTTYYSDEAPAETRKDVSLIELTETGPTGTDPENDFYSIENQWQRFNKERVEREKLQLERAKLEASEQPLIPTTASNNRAENDQRIIVYPRPGYIRHGHKRFHKKSRYRASDRKKMHSQNHRPNRKSNSGALKGAVTNRSDYLLRK